VDGKDFCFSFRCEVTAVNEELDDNPALINEDTYGKGWIFEMKIDNTDELNNLMKGDAAAEWLKGEIKKHSK